MSITIVMFRMNKLIAADVETSTWHSTGLSFCMFYIFIKTNVILMADDTTYKDYDVLPIKLVNNVFYNS